MLSAQGLQNNAYFVHLEHSLVNASSQQMTEIDHLPIIDTYPLYPETQISRHL